jgi:hypothetical protein
VHRTVTSTRRVPFRRLTLLDPALPPGTSQLQTCGIPGTERLVWSETWLGGVRQSRRLLGRHPVQPPVTEIRLVAGPRAVPDDSAARDYSDGMTAAGAR